MNKFERQYGKETNTPATYRMGSSDYHSLRYVRWLETALADKEREMKEVRENNALSDVLAERKAQDAKWGEQNHDMFTWVTILMEEVGEFCKEVLTLKFHQGSTDGQCGSTEEFLEHIAKCARVEAVQVAAVALAIVECIDRRNLKAVELNDYLREMRTLESRLHSGDEFTPAPKGSIRKALTPAGEADNEK